MFNTHEYMKNINIIYTHTHISSKGQYRLHIKLLFISPFICYYTDTNYYESSTLKYSNFNTNDMKMITKLLILFLIIECVLNSKYLIISYCLLHKVNTKY